MFIKWERMFIKWERMLFYSWAVVAHDFNPSTWEADRWISEFEASLVYRVSSMTARATQ